MQYSVCSDLSSSSGLSLATRDREHCRSSAILQLICAAIARTVIGFLKITINSVPSLSRVCVYESVCLTRRPHIYIHIEMYLMMYDINFNSATQKERATDPPGTGAVDY